MPLTWIGIRSDEALAVAKRDAEEPFEGRLVQVEEPLSAEERLKGVVPYSFEDHGWPSSPNLLGPSQESFGPSGPEIPKKQSGVGIHCFEKFEISKFSTFFSNSSRGSQA